MPSIMFAPTEACAKYHFNRAIFSLSAGGKLVAAAQLL